MAGIMSVRAPFTVPAQTVKAQTAKFHEAGNYNKAGTVKGPQPDAFKKESANLIKKDSAPEKTVAGAFSILQNNSSQKNNKTKELTPIERRNNRSLSLDVDKELNIVIASIIDKESGEVVRQIPPEQKVELMRYLKEHPGTLFSRHS